MSKTIQKIGGIAGAGTAKVVDNSGVAEIHLDGVKVLAAQQSAIADAVVAHDVNATFSDTEVEAALDALGVKINAVIAALEAHGILAS